MPMKITLDPKVHNELIIEVDNGPSSPMVPKGDHFRTKEGKEAQESLIAFAEALLQEEPKRYKIKLVKLTRALTGCTLMDGKKTVEKILEKKENISLGIGDEVST